ncbi:nitroreductase family protein [Chloroflexota bacterium]
MEYDSLLELVKRRRSIRKFQPKPIPDECLDKILEVAHYAPSGANSQPWEFVVVKDDEPKRRIIELIKEDDDKGRKIEMLREPELRFPRTPAGYFLAPVFIILCGDARLKDAYPLSSNDHRKSVIFYSSLANVFLYMTLAATTLDLGAQWVSAVNRPYIQPFVKDMLAIPKELEIYDMLAVGYPDMRPKPRIVRDIEEMTHHGKYNQAIFRTQEQLRDFIKNLCESRSAAYNKL